MRVTTQDYLVFKIARCSLHNSGVPDARSNNVTSDGSVSSRMAATMSGASVVRLTIRLTYARSIPDLENQVQRVARVAQERLRPGTHPQDRQAGLSSRSASGVIAMKTKPIRFACDRSTAWRRWQMALAKVALHLNLEDRS